MTYDEIVRQIADILKEFDSERPVHKHFQPGIGPFGEPQIVKIIAQRLSMRGIPANTKRSPDLQIGSEWGIEFKIVRPFGDNGNEAENWTVNLTHPYPGSVSLIGDAFKLLEANSFVQRALFVIGYEHNPAKISLEPLLRSFEVIASNVIGLKLGKRIEEKRTGLVHPEHQVLRCIGWALLS